MSRAGQIRAVVFDFDGTLVDSLSLVLASITHALEPFGALQPAREILKRLGGPPERFMRVLLDDVTSVPAALERMERYHREHVHLIRPYDGATNLLTKLRDAGVKLAIWTGRERASADWLLREHRLADFFGAVLCGDDLPSHKPDPAGLREIMSRLGVKPEETLFVGDADVDVLGGVGCGVDTLLIRHDREVELHIESQSWRTVASPHEAYEVVLASLQSWRS